MAGARSIPFKTRSPPLPTLAEGRSSVQAGRSDAGAVRAVLGRVEGWTLLTLTQRGVPSGDIEGGFTEGWNEFLDGLVARIQTRPAT
jgi:hypothetical protein